MSNQIAGLPGDASRAGWGESLTSGSGWGKGKHGHSDAGRCALSLLYMMTGCAKGVFVNQQQIEFPISKYLLDKFPYYTIQYI